MQYLVREFRTNAPVDSSETKVFNSIPEALKHIQKINNTEQLLLEPDGKVDQIDRYLNHRLDTVSIRAQVEEKRQWTITAFE